MVAAKSDVIFYAAGFIDMLLLCMRGC